MEQSETTTSSVLAEIGPFAKHEIATRNHVRTLAERIETSLAAAIEALAGAGAARVPSSATFAVALAHVTAEVWANPAWRMRKSGEIDADERAGEIRESADFSANQVLMNVAPAHQAPYRAEVIIRSAGAIVHAEVLMVTGIAGCETESGFTAACLSADSDTVEELDGKALAARTNRVINGEGRDDQRPIAEEIDPKVWAERWGRIMLRHARRRGVIRYSPTASATPKRRAMAMSSRTRSALADASPSPSSA